LCRKALTLVAVLGLALATFGCSDDGGGGGAPPDLRSLNGTRIVLTTVGLGVLESQEFQVPGTALNEGSNLENITITFDNAFRDRDNSGDISAGDRLGFTVTSDDVNPPVEEDGVLIVGAIGSPTVANFILRFTGGTFPDGTLPALGAGGDPELTCAGNACRLQVTASNVPVGGVDVPGQLVLVLTNQAGTAVTPPASSATNVQVEINNNGRVFIDGVNSGLVVAVD
jgi:hypothetical protein